MQYDRTPVIRTGLPPLSPALIRLVRVKNFKFRDSPFLVVSSLSFLRTLFLITWLS